MFYQSLSFRTTRNQRQRSPLAFEQLEPRQLLAGDLVIAEFLASNDNGLRDEDRDRSDWIELLNDSAADIQVNGWFLTDDAEDLDKWRFPDVTLGAGERLVVFASAKHRTQPDSELHTNFRLNAAGGYLALVEPDGLTVAQDFGDQYASQLPDISLGLAQAVKDLPLHLTGDSARMLIPRDDALGQSWMEIGFDDSSWFSAETGVGYGSRFDDVFQTDIEAQMRAVNSSVYLRMPFQIDNPNDVSSLSLTITYNDGYVALLNGVEVARANAPEELTWNSLATERRRPAPSLVAEELDLSPFVDLLNDGENVLAIHGLNSDSNSGRFLIVPELAARASDGPPLDQLSHFNVPSPGGANGLGSTTKLVNVTHSPTSPSESEELTVTAEVISTVADGDTPVELHYRAMFDAETSMAMFDDGLHGDGQAGDGVFGAIIPAGVAPAGQMIRYRLTAGHSDASISHRPAFVDPLNSQQYFGTIVHDPSVDSNLPVLHLFMQDPAASETSTGTRGSMYHDGQFYDNIEIDVTGRTIGRTGPKKSHDIFFPRDHWFELADQQLRMDDFDIMTDYWNRSKLRIPLAYQTLVNIGVPSHLSFPVRTQRNGEFFGTYSFVDGGNEKFLERAGLDPRGALYKMNLGFSAHEASFKKQTREYEDNSDVEALFENLDLMDAQRAQYLWDNINIPATVNYLVGLVLMGHGDCCSKNLYLYRDTEGTGQWQPLPWDVDSAFGRGGARSEPIFPQAAGVDTAGRGNSLFAAMFQDVPGFRDMYLRRLRTVLDEFLQPPGTPTEDLKFERRIDEMVEQLAPDAALDFEKWGSWKTDPATDVTTFGTENVPSWQEQVDILKNEYFPARRVFLYDSLAEANGGQGVQAQTAAPALRLGQIEFNPASGNQDEEFIEVTNPLDVSVDVSGWQLTGDVQHTFHPGTVIPPNESLYVSPNVNAFRARHTGPSGGQGLFVQGDYEGHISNHGATIRLVTLDGLQIGEVTTSADLTPVQKFLRISEIMYHPREPAPGSRFDADDFEFIELVNISTSETIDLENVAFSEGVRFVFPRMSLAPGEHIVVARDEIALAQRYGPDVRVAGQYGDTADDLRLNNNGESLHLEIATGDLVQQFTYDDTWIPVTDGIGNSLTVIDIESSLDRWNIRDGWQASAKVDGSPGTDDQVGPPAGDSNNDNRFDRLDIVFVLQAGKYLTGQPASFSEGDWNADGVFDQLDITAALQSGTYQQ